MTGETAWRTGEDTMLEGMYIGDVTPVLNCGGDAAVEKKNHHYFEKVIIEVLKISQTRSHYLYVVSD